jgi:transcriptional regulator with XRE-family HTH domain
VEHRNRAGEVDENFIDESDRRDNQPALGRAIRELREHHGNLTPEALAERAEVDLRLLGQMEAGEGGDWNSISWVLDALGVSMGEFAALYEEFLEEEEEGGTDG